MVNAVQPDCCMFLMYRTVCLLVCSSTLCICLELEAASRVTRASVPGIFFFFSPPRAKGPYSHVADNNNNNNRKQNFLTETGTGRDRLLRLDSIVFAIKEGGSWY